ncbi:MAG: hypothetical protein AABX34_00550 [Nanoarchaeota archaeon]
MGELQDSEGKASDISTKGHRGNGDYDIRLNEKTELEYVMKLISQSYEKNR